MKVKLLAAAFAALGSAAAFAAPLNPQTAAPAADHIVYIGGASAQKNAIDTLLRTTNIVFNTGADVVKLTTSSSNIFGYLGTAAADGQPLLIVYNFTNGSAAGINQLLSSGTGEAEATVLALTGTNNGCTATTGGAGTWTSTCSGTAAREIDMALSDVFATEFGSSGSLCTAASATCPGPSYITLADIKSPIAAKSTGLEGFGVIVNANLYNDLLTQNIAEGKLAAACSTATAPSAVSAGCQPSIRSRDYAALVTRNSGWDSYVLTGKGGIATTIERRDEFSGTQAASNIFFLNNVCGAKGYFGKLVPARAADSSAALKLTFVENASTSNLETVIGTTTTGYALGVVSTAEKDDVDTAGKNFWFVKIDGVSPNVYNGAYDATHKQTLLDGSYQFATEMGAYVRNGIAGIKATVTTAVANGMSSSTINPTGLNGIGYLDNNLAWPDGVQAKFVRGGNNCAPLH